MDKMQSDVVDLWGNELTFPHNTQSQPLEQPDLFLQNVWKLYGLSRSMLSDCVRSS